MRDSAGVATAKPGPATNWITLWTQLLLLMQLANTVFSDKTAIAASTVLLVVALDILVVMLAVILFPFLWKD